MGARPGTNNGGGPKTPEGRARALANLDPLASVKHGAYLRPQAPCCDTCELAGECSGAKPSGTCDPEDVRRQIVAEVMALPHIREEDRPEVELYATLRLRWQMPWLYPVQYAARTPRGLFRAMEHLGLLPGRRRPNQR